MNHHSLLSIICVGMITDVATAQKPTMDLESLEAVPGVMVVVEGVTADAAADGLTADSLHTAIEAMIGEAGIATLSEWEWRNLIGNPALQLTLQLLKPSPHLYLYSGTLELRQLTVLVRDSTKAAFTRTWSSGSILGTKPTRDIATLHADVRRLVEEFIAAYRDAVRRAGSHDPIPVDERPRTVVTRA